MRRSSITDHDRRGPDERAAAIPLNDLRRQLDALGPAMRKAVDDVVRSGWYLFGPRVTEFEAQFAAYCGVRHCLTVANGTDALELALRAVGCGPGSEVITVANAGMYTSAAIVATVGSPVLVDIDAGTMTMAPESLARAVGPRTKAVVVTHLYGQLADVEALTAIARRHGIAVIEDCAQAHGARRHGRMAGAWGDIGCFSFYPTKNLGALGDGGAVVTQDDALAAAVRELRQYGWTSKYRAARPHGRNSRLDEIQAAVLQLKLNHLDAWNERRRSIVRRYRQAAEGGVIIPDATGMDHVAHLCVARSSARDALRTHLADDGIATDVHYPVPDHRQPALRSVVPPDLSLPATEKAVDEILTLPCFPELTDEEVQRICDSLARFGERVAPRERANSAP
jgi:dTDP-3-amino-2,3,6-trideoxy-4-keto-D-glucose/dTDP-3-amino-3,4,6-trideoxy-alpha-D-glucose/dTDP-2,6-dideoxy-D-kanosamine transaminase